MADDRTTVKLGNVPYRGNAGFAFHEVHIHLGKSESRGSEHSVDNRFYPMEVKHTDQKTGGVGKSKLNTSNFKY